MNENYVTLTIGKQKNIALIAHDAAPARMADLPARAARAGVKIALSPSQKLGHDHDLVLIDVPCSGSGTWRRTPDAKWRLDAAGLDRLLATQAGILRDAAKLVRPGGVLAYMTCSLLDQENQDQIAAFLRGNGDFRREADKTWLVPEGSDGFYLSLLRRAGPR